MGKIALLGVGTGAIQTLAANIGNMAQMVVMLMRHTRLGPTKCSTR